MGRHLRVPRTVVGTVLAAGILVTGWASTPKTTQSENGFRDIAGTETNVDVDTKAELDAFLGSDAPKTIYLSGSGEFSRVEAGNQVPDLGRSEDSPCQAQDLCLPGR